jgi:hypothetical protein
MRISHRIEPSKHMLAAVIAAAVALAMASPPAARAEREGEARAATEASSTAALEAAPLRVASDAAVQAALESRVDARRVSVGDEVRARTTQSVDLAGGGKLPRGTRLIGRVTEARAAAGSESRLGIQFDRVVTSDGREYAADLAIQALAEAEARSAPTLGESAAARRRGTAEPRSSRSSGGGLLGGAIGGAADAVVGAEGVVGGAVDTTLGGAAEVGSSLSASTTGVVGLPGLRLDAAATSSTVVSASGPVVLASGTRMVLRARADSAAQ